MEIASHSSSGPGSFFHAQMLGESQDDMFPEWLDVPRFPIPLFSPPAVIEFVLAELFQDRWKRDAFRTKGLMETWISIQKPRLQSILAWQQSNLAGIRGVSPWSKLKSISPDEDIFMGNLR